MGDDTLKPGFTGPRSTMMNEKIRVRPILDCLSLAI